MKKEKKRKIIKWTTRLLGLGLLTYLIYDWSQDNGVQTNISRYEPKKPVPYKVKTYYKPFKKTTK